MNQEAGAPDETLFALSAVRGRGAAASLADAAVPGEAQLDEMEADDRAARQLVAPEAPGSSASDSEQDERCRSLSTLRLRRRLCRSRVACGLCDGPLDYVACPRAFTFTPLQHRP